MSRDGFGDEFTVDELIARKEPLLEIMASERNRDPSMWQDEVQEARIAVWEASQRPHRTDAYLHAAARNRLSEVVNRQTWTGHTRHHGQPTDPLRQPSTGSLDEMADAGMVLVAAEVLAGVEFAYHHGEIARAIDSLPVHHRAYVLLRFWGGLTAPEIAAKAGVTANHVNRWWYESIKPRLREKLGHLVAV